MRVTIKPIRRPVDGSRQMGALFAWCLSLLMLAGVAAARNAAAGEPEIVARVNGVPLTWAAFQRMRANPLVVSQLQQSGAQPDATALDRLALQTLKQRHLMLQEAAQRNITVTPKELDEAIAALRRRFEGLREFGEWMMKQGLDEESVFAAVREDMLTDRVISALLEDVSITDKQVQQYYETHRDDLRADEVRLQIIVARDKATAAEILRALRDGRDFASLARQHSIGRRAAKGGDTGWARSEMLWPPLRKLVAAMQAGEAGGPLQKGNELLIVRLDERRPGSVKSLSEARPQIEPQLLAAKRQEAVRAWLAQQEKRAKIEVFLPSLATDPDPGAHGVLPAPRKGSAFIRSGIPLALARPAGAAGRITKRGGGNVLNWTSLDREPA
jgi:parvulin-like peptidyl-prolyl isomerase